jgi:hypothetical protein
VADPEASLAVKVGVLLARQPDDLVDWLADGAAFEAAGADALWVDLAAESELDPFAVVAALAAVTYRSLLVTALPGAAERPRTLATIARLGRGRLRVLDAPASAVGLPDSDRWVPVPAPDGRASWLTALSEAAERGDHGLVVPADPRLLDLLRNPDDPGERMDLQLAVG